MGDKPTITIVTTHMCNFNCRLCPSACHVKNKYGNTVIDFVSVVSWLNRFFPGCNVHVSGGEPLLLGNISELLLSLIGNGHNVSLFTNGSRLPHHPELLELPITWCVAHHPESISTEQFLDNTAPIITKPHMIVRLNDGPEMMRDRTKTMEAYKKYNSRVIVPFGGYFKYSAAHTDSKPCEKILMIETDGVVYPCSTSKGIELGSVYNMTFDHDAAGSFECTRGVDLSECQAYQTDELLKLAEKEKGKKQ